MNPPPRAETPSSADEPSSEARCIRQGSQKSISIDDETYYRTPSASRSTSPSMHRCVLPGPSWPLYLFASREAAHA